ncbi:MAG TPA: urea amidolyase associated protein UAAP1 [Acidimicrobiales bacterium]|nr:urea amidolyase associated protein UAAP1 [Acidimicrobiales bacterium]
MTDAPPEGPTGSAAPASTGTPEAARLHARAQAGTTAEHMPTLPATGYPATPSGYDPADLVWAERVAGGGYTHRVVAAGTTIRLSDIEGDACAHLLLYREGEPWERINVADTIKVQWQAYLGPGHLLLSDQGRVLASIISDSSGHHDAICGTSSRRRNQERFGAGSPESGSPAGRELFILAGAKHGLGRRDLPPSLSFFKGVRVDPESGTLGWVGSVGAPAAVELRAEMPLVVLIANTAHPLDPRPGWACSTLEVLARTGQPTPPGSWPRTVTPEAERAFLNNDEDRVARAVGGAS